MSELPIFLDRAPDCTIDELRELMTEPVCKLDLGDGIYAIYYPQVRIYAEREWLTTIEPSAHPSNYTVAYLRERAIDTIRDCANPEPDEGRERYRKLLKRLEGADNEQP